MKRNIFKKILTTTVLTATILTTNVVISNAALQSNGGTSAKKTVDTWLLQIRKMQEMGGTLGRNDTIDTTNLKSDATDLDIHMEKNTEYGAMAILSASAYGNPNKIANGGTTTGNASGIVININKEWVAASYNNPQMPVFSNALNRYKNLYENRTYVAKVGDAITETQGWHGSGSSQWLNTDGVAPTLIRSYSGSIFSYYGNSHLRNSAYTYATYDAYFTNEWATRAVIVVGTGV